MNGDDAIGAFFWGIIVAAVVAALVPDSRTLPKEIAWAQKVCAANNGLSYMRASGFLVPTRAVCINGAIFKSQPSQMQ